MNVARLNEFKSRLVLFPRRHTRKGDASEEERSLARQLKGDIISAPKSVSAISSVKISEVPSVN